MRFLKRVLIWLLIGFVSLMLILVIAATFFDKEIKSAVISTLNSRLKTEVKTGDVDFSLIRHFPYAAVVFTDVTVLEKQPFITTGTVLTAAKLSLLFNIWDVLSGKYNLKKLVVSSGTLNLQIASDGTKNYDIWKGSSGGGTMQLELESVEVEKMRVLYYSVADETDMDFFAENGTLSGNFTGDKFTIQTIAELKDAGFKSGGVRYINDKEIKLKLFMDADRSGGIYVIRDANVKLHEFDLDVKGTIKDNADGNYFDLDLNSPGSSLRAVFALLPGDFTKRIDDFEYSGNVNFHCSVKGPSKDPLVIATFNAANSGLTPRGSNYHLSNMRFNGSFTNQKSKSNPVTLLQIGRLTGKLEGRPITAEFEIENFRHPHLRIKATLDASLEVVSRFYIPDTLQYMKGQAKLNASFSGTPGISSSYVSSGTLQLTDVGFKIKGRPLEYRKCNGTLRLQGGDVIADGITMMAGASDLRLSGTITDLAGYLAGSKDPLIVRATLASTYLNLDELMAKDQALGNGADTSYRFKLTGFVNFALGVKIDSLKFRKFTASSIQGEIQLRDKTLATRELDMNTSDGKIRLKGMIDGRKADSLKIDYDALITNMNINRLFYEMGNFGQTVIVDKNLKGRINAQVLFRSTWDNRLQVNPKTIIAKSDLTVIDGELINFEPMLALSRYLKGTDLKDIRFSTLTNTIDIKNETIIIPQMEIHSSALDLTLSGTHGFDNKVDYKLQLYLSQLMGRKVRQLNTEFGTIEEDGYGRSRIFMTVKGTASNPIFSMDRKSVEDKITSEIKKEAKSFKETLKQEFGRNKLDTIPPVKEKKKQEELQIEFDE
ncbi:MAG TPA: AsmA-like C-terminal region-containing protein [Bacteroidia bacterium]|nr:AsmA-like C-terminal region-containing protein [Bacteroidia bacterium]